MSEKMNEKLQEAINEAVLKAAFAEAAEQDIAELEAMDIEVPSPTEKQRKEVEKAICNIDRKKRHSANRAWRAVAMIAIVFCVAASIIMVQPTVRASVWDFVVSFYEKYLSFDFDEEEPLLEYEFGEHSITYLPNGYQLIERSENPLKMETIFSDGESTIIIWYYDTELNALNFDYGDAEKKDLTINNVAGYLISQKDSATKWLMWGDESSSFIIKATISEKELKKIAENVE